MHKGQQPKTHAVLPATVSRLGLDQAASSRDRRHDGEHGGFEPSVRCTAEQNSGHINSPRALTGAYRASDQL